MTIGIVAFGPNAGLAVFRALRAVEAVARGAIGGFAAFAAITQEGEVLRHQTQRGGSATLFLNGGAVAQQPPPDVASAYIAGLMSSGPDRPEPLSQYVAADPELGIVSGHRMPNNPGLSGQPLYVEILARMRDGCSTQKAVDLVIGANPEADAGVIAIDRAGGVYARNSDRVARRPDTGAAQRVQPADGAAVAVLHNSIFPSTVLADLAADVVMDTMVPPPPPDGWITVHAGTPVERGFADAVIVSEDMVARKIMTAEARPLTGRWVGSAIYLGSEIRFGEIALGRTTVEPFVIVENGRIVSMSGQTSFRLGFGKPSSPEDSLIATMLPRQELA